MDAAPRGIGLAAGLIDATYQPNIAADRKTGSSCCPFGVARKNQEQDALDVGGGSDRSVSTNPPRLFCSARVRTWHETDQTHRSHDVRCRGKTGSHRPTSKPTRLVESRCGAVALGRTYLLPPLSSGGALVASPWLRSTSRSSNRTGRFPASGSRTRLHA
jgi:hypothetical protein